MCQCCCQGQVPPAPKPEERPQDEARCQGAPVVTPVACGQKPADKPKA